MSPILAGCLTVVLGAAHPADPDDPLLKLPALPPVVPLPVQPLSGTVEELAPGVRMVRGAAVILSGSILRDQGPPDGLEVFACLRDGKSHEALIRLDSTSGQVIKAACIAALGAPDGEVSDEGSGIPARGTPMMLTVRWRDRDGRQVSIPASCLVRDRVMDRPYPPLPFIYTGSRFQRLHLAAPDGGPTQEREVFMLDTTRSLAVDFDEPDALFASPFPGAAVDIRFEAYSGRCPPPGTVVELVITPAVLPLHLTLAADGALSDDRGRTLDESALQALLGAVYGPAGHPALRAVLIRVGAASARQADVACRTRILAAAAQAGAWVVPVFGQ